MKSLEIDAIGQLWSTTAPVDHRHTQDGPIYFEPIGSLRESKTARGRKNGFSEQRLQGRRLTMSAAKKRILIMGATGQVGGLLLPYLSKDKSVEVVAGARSPEKAKALGIPSVYLDLDNAESMMPAFTGVDRIFLMTGYTVDMLRQSKDVVDVAKKAGVEQIVHLGACGDDDTHVGHYGWHQFIERYISSSGIPFYTHLRPEMFMQNLLGYGGESFVKQGVIHQYIGDARLSWVDCDDVAAAAAAALLDPKKHHGQTYRMGYEAKSYHEIAELMTKLLGKSFRYQSHPATEFLENVLAAGGEPAYMKCVYECYRDFATGKLIGDEVQSNFQSIVGRQPRTLAEFIEKNSSVFSY
jgi:NAD(P)H dehydrogenase (quinone)